MSGIFRRLCISLLLMLALPPAVERASAQAQEKIIAIRAGRLIDGTGAPPVRDAVILIQGRRILRVGAGLPVSPGAEVIDLSRRTVLPGFTDMHTHITTEDPGPRALERLSATGADAARGGIAPGATVALSWGGRDRHAPVTAADLRALNAASPFVQRTNDYLDSKLELTTAQKAALIDQLLRSNATYKVLRAVLGLLHASDPAELTTLMDGGGRAAPTSARRSASPTR